MMKLKMLRSCCRNTLSRRSARRVGRSGQLSIATGPALALMNARISVPMLKWSSCRAARRAWRHRRWAGSDRGRAPATDPGRADRSARHRRHRRSRSRDDLLDLQGVEAGRHLGAGDNAPGRRLIGQDEAEHGFEIADVAGVVLAVIEQEANRILADIEALANLPAPFGGLDRAEAFDDEHAAEQAERIGTRGLVEHPGRQR